LAYRYLLLQFSLLVGRLPQITREAGIENGYGVSQKKFQIRPKKTRTATKKSRELSVSVGIGWYPI
jgi:hypothetical protein